MDRLREGDESVEIEAKRARQIDRSILESVCALSNEPGRGGGYLLLGVVRNEARLFPDYEVVGVTEVDKLQSDLATQCRNEFNIPICPQVFVENLDKKTVLWAFVPEVDPQEKPVFIRSLGLPRGAFRRIGSTDQHGTEEDIAFYYQQRGHKTFEESAIEDLDPGHELDSAAIQTYRKLRAKVTPGAQELEWTDAELLHALGATARHKGKLTGTVCGLLAFGRPSSLRRHFPLARVDYIRVEGREWVQNPDERYQTVEMRGPLMTLIPRVVSQILDDIPRAFSLAEDQIHRRDVPLIPRKVIREAVVNALMHRSYRIRQPVQVIRYSNRLEIRNPGHSLKPDDRLGEPGSVSRNEKLAVILHEVGLAETKGSGIRVMREYMRRANLTLPFFESDREADTFTVTLLVHHLLGEEDIRWLARFKRCGLSEDEARSLVFVREVGAISNAAYRDINSVDTLVASGHLRRLRDHGLLAQKGKAAQTYYVPGPLMVKSLQGGPASAARAGRAAPPLSTEPAPLSTEFRPLSADLSLLRSELPRKLADEVSRLGQRATPDRLDHVLLALVHWRSLSLAELESLLQRKTTHLRRSIRRLIADGRIRYLYADKPQHPDQKYIAGRSPKV